MTHVPDEQYPTVFWAVLLERNIGEKPVDCLLDVAAQAGANGYGRIKCPYTASDIARNAITAAFRELARHPTDTLIMLDNDHQVPMHILQRLAEHEAGVVGALAFRRSIPYFPCFFERGPDGRPRVMTQWEGDGLRAGMMVGTGVIAIKRWVFDQLEEAGYRPPFFRYQYPTHTAIRPSEDIYFGEICEAAGIPHHVDLGCVIPHVTEGVIDADTWRAYAADHPEVLADDYDHTLLMAPRLDKAVEA